jgi:hypothetical protein
MKVVLKPFVGVERKWRITVINEIPNVPPMDLNMPRNPVMVATSFRLGFKIVIF